MNKPTIEINGKTFELPKPTAAIWRNVMEFDSAKKSIKVADFIDEHLAIIALAFGVNKDDLIDKIEIEDVLPTYNEIVLYLTNLVFSKIGNNKKNEDDMTEQN